MIMNEAKWKQISPADQASLDKFIGEALARRAGKAWDAADARGEKAARRQLPVAIASPSSSPRSSSAPRLQQAWIEKAKAKAPTAPPS